MAEVVLTIGGRSYRLACRDGEEAALRAAGALLEARVAPLQEAHGAVREPRLLLMAGLILAGELLQNPQTAANAQSSALSSDVLEQLAHRAEILAEKLEEAATAS